MSAVQGPGRGGMPESLAALKDGHIKGNKARLKAATRLLEGTFYQELFKAMRETIPKGGAIPSGSGDDMFTGFLDQHVADEAAGRDANGPGQALYRYFLRSLPNDTES